MGQKTLKIYEKATEDRRIKIMILFAIFKVLLAVYITIILPPIVIYIGNETDDFSVKSDKDYFLIPLKLFVMIIPGVAVIKAYKIYKKNNIRGTL